MQAVICYTETTMISAVDDSVSGTQGITLSAYCCIPLQSTLSCTNQPKAFAASEDCP